MTTIDPHTSLGELDVAPLAARAEWASLSTQVLFQAVIAEEHERSVS